MEKGKIDELKAAFEEMIALPPFNGTVNHRTRGAFISKWKELMAARGVQTYEYVDLLSKALGKRG